jgi:hypothetical protein
MSLEVRPLLKSAGMRTKNLSIALLLLGGCVAELTSSDLQESLVGALFTTTMDGSFVNKNIYSAKEDVYLDGGPRSLQDARLPAGTYVFQVTDPSGKTLLSTDDPTCREFTIDANGFISSVGIGACAHMTGSDGRGGLTVQLMPFNNTPNNGGEYKAWVEPVDVFNSNGGVFDESSTKTDNFKFIAPSCSGTVSL